MARKKKLLRNLKQGTSNFMTKGQKWRRTRPAETLPSRVRFRLRNGGILVPLDREVKHPNSYGVGSLVHIRHKRYVVQEVYPGRKIVDILVQHA